MSSVGLVRRAGVGGVVRASVLRRLTPPVVVALPVVAAASFVAFVDPSTHHYSTCPWLSTFGVYCPGCGGIRALHALTHGNLLGALDFNAFATLFMLVTGVLWAWWLVARFRGRQLRGRLIPVVLFGLLAFLPVFTVIRNLPFGQVLAP